MDAEQRDDESPERPPTGIEEPPGRDPGEVPREPDPHRPLNNPAGEPDESEWPDPYESRPDPRFPASVDETGGEQPHTPDGAQSTSQPHPDQDVLETDPPERERMDE